MKSDTEIVAHEPGGVAATETARVDEVAQGRAWAALVPLLAIAATVVVIDRLTKLWILDNLAGPNGRYIQEIIPGWLQFRYVENTGAAFGLFRDGGWVLAIIAALVSAAIVYAAPRIHQDTAGTTMRWPGLIGLALVLGGAIGNLIDRLLYGYVVDFVDVTGLFIEIDNRRYQWWVFNVADSAISIGILLLLASLLFAKRKDDA